MKLYLVLFIISFRVSLISCQSSGCPEFQIDNTKNEVGKYSGELTLTSDVSLTGVWIEITFNETAQLVESPFSEVSISDNNKKFKIENLEYILKADNELKIPIIVQYNDAAPTVESISLNARTVCPEPPATYITKCPGIFYFNPDNPEYEKLWYGTLKISSEFDLTGVWIQVFLSSPVELFGATFGEIETKNNKEILIKGLDYTLQQGEVLNISIFAKYADLPDVPNVNVIRLNGRTICGRNEPRKRYQTTTEEPDILESTTTEFPILAPRTSELPLLPPTSELPLLPPTTSKSPIILAPASIIRKLPEKNETLTDSALNLQFNSISLPPEEEYDDVECGTIAIQERIIGGKISTITQFPWHGAIFAKEGSNVPEYICGMTLISRRHAITAAHCFVDSSYARRNLNDVFFYFGVDNLNHLDAPGIQNPKVERVTMTTDYVHPRPKNDFAIIKFATPLRFTNYVRPVCLWEEDVNLGIVEWKNGTVIGYGVTENQERSNNLRTSEILVVDNESCRELNPLFYTILDRNSYCAGNLHGSAVCNGDSGSGMFFKKRKNGRWQIRGLVSTSRRKYDSCDTSVYAIFTDVAKYKYLIEIIANTF